MDYNKGAYLTYLADLTTKTLDNAHNIERDDA